MATHTAVQVRSEVYIGKDLFVLGEGKITLDLSFWPEYVSLYNPKSIGRLNDIITALF